VTCLCLNFELTFLVYQTHFALSEPSNTDKRSLLSIVQNNGDVFSPNLWEAYLGNFKWSFPGVSSQDPKPLTVIQVVGRKSRYHWIEYQGHPRSTQTTNTCFLKSSVGAASQGCRFWVERSQRHLLWVVIVVGHQGSFH